MELFLANFIVGERSVQSRSKFELRIKSLF